MNALQTSLYAFINKLLVHQDGQDLVEYSLIFSLIAFGAVSGMGYLASGINNVFSSTAAVLTTSIT